MSVAERVKLFRAVRDIPYSIALSLDESETIIRQIDATPPEAWQDFFDHNRAFLGAINNWLEQHRSRSRTHAQTH